MINLTKEQIVESLERLKDYSQWMYFSELCGEMLKNQKVTFENHTFYLSLAKDGLIEMVLEDGVIGRFDFRIQRIAPLNNLVNNVDFQTKLISVTRDDSEHIEYFNKNEVRMFICSFIQRQMAFTFFARMQPETINGISEYLVACNK